MSDRRVEQSRAVGLRVTAPRTGFVIDAAEVVFRGLCPGCRSSNHTGAPSE